MEITFYDTTGRITGMARVKDDMVDMIKSPEGSTHPHVDGNYFAQAATKYVLAGAIADRPANPAILTGLELTALPVPCTIQINAASYPCTEDHATLSFGLPGTYKVTVKAFPMLDKEFSIAYPA